MAMSDREDQLAIFEAIAKTYQALTGEPLQVPSPPRCVSVVKDLEAMGVNLNVLAQAGRVIQGDHSDAVYLEAVA
ncbi:MAG TPA: hypothetical protein VN713_00040 [Sphingomicrobium sp.]|nr:hypothetical protein [Sphingomicrobium sp.]